jgi:hypothetical protein
VARFRQPEPFKKSAPGQQHVRLRSSLRNLRWLEITPARFRQPQFLRDLDKIHIANKYRATGRPGPGRWSTPWVPSTKRVDNLSEAPVGLPVNFYDEDWLRDIGAEARKELHVQPRIELAFSEGTRQWVTCFSHSLLQYSPTLIGS